MIVMQLGILVINCAIACAKVTYLTLLHGICRLERVIYLSLYVLYINIIILLINYFLIQELYNYYILYVIIPKYKYYTPHFQFRFSRKCPIFQGELQIIRLLYFSLPLHRYFRS